MITPIVVIFLLVVAIAIRLYYCPHPKCFFGSHKWAYTTRHWDEVPASRTCMRTGCTAYHIRGIDGWHVISGYRCP